MMNKTLHDVLFQFIIPYVSACAIVLVSIIIINVWVDARKKPEHTYYNELMCTFCRQMVSLEWTGYPRPIVKCLICKLPMMQCVRMKNPE